MKKEFYSTAAIEQAAQLMGSLSKLALALNMTYGSIFKWAHGQAIPSPLSCMKIEKVTKGKIKKEDVRPNFDWENFELL